MGNWFLYPICTDLGKPVGGVKLSIDGSPERTTGPDGQTELSKNTLGDWGKIPNGNFNLKITWKTALGETTAYARMELFSDRADAAPAGGIKLDDVEWWGGSTLGWVKGEKKSDVSWRPAAGSQKDPYQAYATFHLILDLGGLYLGIQPITTGITPTAPTPAPTVSTDWLGLGGVLGPLFRSFQDYIGEQFRPFWQWLSQGLTALGDKFMAGIAGLPRAFAAGLSAAQSWIFLGFQQFWQWLDVTVIKPARQGIASLQSQISAWGQASFQQIVSFLSPRSPALPEHAPGHATMVMGALIASGLLLGGMTCVGELVHPLKELGLGNLSAFLYDVAGYKVIASALVGVLVGASIQTPLRYAMNAWVRPSQFDVQTALRLYLKGLISKPDAARYLTYEGFDDAKIKQLFDDAARELSYRELKLVIEDYLPEDAWLLSKLKRAQYAPDDSALLARVLKAAALKPARSKIMGAAERAYKEGRLDETELKSIYKGLGIRADLANLYLWAARLAFEFDEVSDQIDALKKAYAKDVITDQELLTGLTGLGVKLERARILVNIEYLKKMGKPKKAS